MTSQEWKKSVLGRYRLVRLPLQVLHHAFFHPLIAVFGGMRWTWYLHDLSGHLAFGNEMNQTRWSGLE